MKKNFNQKGGTINKTKQQIDDWQNRTRKTETKREQ